MHWFAMLLQVDKKTCCLVRSDFKGNNIFNFFSDDEKGINQIDTVIHNIIASGQRITFGIDCLAIPFIKSGPRTVWQHLVQIYGSQLYELTDIDEKDRLAAYIPKANIDLISSTKHDCSVLLLERNAPVAFYSYLHDTKPPFHPIDVASLGCGIIAHHGLSRFLCSMGTPPSSQDIEVFLKEGKDGTLFSMVMTTNVLFVILRTPATPEDYDKEEFYLCHSETVSKFKKYGINLAYKLAVFESCRMFKLGLACSSLYAKHEWEELNGEKVTNLVESENYIVPLNVKSVR